MSTRYTFITVAIIVLVTIAFGLWAYPRLPEMAASHWNAQGEVDGYTSRGEAVAVFPILTVVVVAILLAVPWIDPLKDNIAHFRGLYNAFVVVFVLFMSYVYVLTLLWSLGVSLQMNRMLAPAFAALLYGAGVLVGNARRNYFIGIRTPWTLNSDWVWDQTHRRGAWLFKGAGIASLLGLVFPNVGLVVLVVAALGVALYCVVYSYVLFRRESSRLSGS
ncbi:MAG: SdpI family protein [Anaerolineaceae bacterium]|jgi:uncharacterized membrane protein|nr:SdpI family protein [Anaerolineaceae bacterium]